MRVCFHLDLNKLPSREATEQELASCEPACPLVLTCGAVHTNPGIEGSG